MYGHSRPLLRTVLAWTKLVSMGHRHRNKGSSPSRLIIAHAQPARIPRGAAEEMTATREIPAHALGHQTQQPVILSIIQRFNLSILLELPLTETRCSCYGVELGHLSWRVTSRSRLSSEVLK